MPKIGVSPRSPAGQYRVRRDPAASPAASDMKKPAFSKAPGEARRSARDTLVSAVLVSVCTALLVNFTLTTNVSDLDRGLAARQAAPPAPAAGRLLFYNKPPKTGSTTIRIAMKKAAEDAGLTAARCFKMIEWNEMSLRTLINRDNVDFYGCHTRLYRERFTDILNMRAGNVTFITNTRDPSNIILSAYLQKNRARNIPDITDHAAIAKEITAYKQYIEEYPVNALYKYHGADVPLTRCPVDYTHVNAMRRIAERYEVVIDLERPDESAAIVEVVTGLKPDFNQHFNERTTNLTGPMLSALAKVDTSHRLCGNQLVHKVLLQQFNLIKDRLMQNMCFDEATGTHEFCDKVVFTKAAMIQRSRDEAQRRRKELEQM